VFVRDRAPLDAPITPEIVRHAMRLAFVRCGLSSRYTGTHVLRRTAATRMRLAGASLKQIADVLRHRSLDTTTIYTKIDRPQLASVAAPWPGGAA
jgi:site-specific recombinase XerD